VTNPVLELTAICLPERPAPSSPSLAPMMRSMLPTATITAIGVAYHAIGCNRNSPGTGWRHTVLPVWSHGLSLLV